MFTSQNDKRRAQWYLWASLLGGRWIVVLPALLSISLLPIPQLVALAQEEAVDASTTDSEELQLLRDLVERGEYEEAEELLSEDYEEDPAIFLLRGRVLRETGRGAQALQELAASEHYTGGDAKVCAFVGRLREERGELVKGEQDFRRALENDANHIAARTQLGLVLQAQGKSEAGSKELMAIRDYYRKLSVAQAREVTPETYVWMGKACKGLNKYHEAYDVMYSSAIQLDPDNATAHLASGFIMLEKYNYPDARSHFKDALKKNSKLAEAHVGLAMSTYVDYRFPGDRFESTLDSLASADFVWKDHPKALILRGHLAFYDENWEVAEDLYRRAIAQNPSDQIAQAQLAAVYYAQNRMADFQRVEKGVTESHPKPAAFYAALAEKLVERFFYREGAEFARKAVEIDEDYWPAYVTLGVNALRAGWDEEGRKWVERAFEADKFNVWAYNTRKLIRHIDANFVEKSSENFRIRMRREDSPFLMPYLFPLLEEAKVEMERRYNVKVHQPITVEDFSKHDYFSARSIGLPGLAASGVCFGRLVTLTTPKAIPGNWGAVARHEFAHVVALAKTQHRVPRWFTEGLSVFEEGYAIKRWNRRYPDEFVEGVHHKQLLPMERLQSGFTKPTFPGQILLCYYQGGLICEYINATYGWEKIVGMLDAYRGGLTTEEVFKTVLDRSLDAFDREFMRFAHGEADELGLWPRYLPSQIPALRARLEDEPEDGDSWVKLGLAYIFSGQVTDAELSIGKAQAHAPKHRDLSALKGFVLFQQKRFEQAKQQFTRALEEDTHYWYRSHLVLGILALEDRDADGAIEHLQSAIEIHPDGIRPRFGKPNPYYLLADLLEAKGKVEKGIEVLESLLVVSRDDVAVRKRLGGYYYAQENWEKVVEVMGDAVYIDPYDMEIHQQLARAYFETQRYSLALRELEVSLESESPAFERIYADMAFCHWKLGANDKAREYAKKALEIDSDIERAVEVMKDLDK